MYNFGRCFTQGSVQKTRLDPETRVSEMKKLTRKFLSFLSNYFGDSYDENVYGKWKKIIWEIYRYCRDGHFGGWCSYYCSETWNDETLENDADFEIFDLLLKMDIQNGADTSKIVHSLCKYSAFEAVKVEFLFLNKP